MRKLHLAVSAALAGVLLAGCSDSGGGASSTAEPQAVQAPATVQPVTPTVDTPVIEEPTETARAATETQTGVDTGFMVDFSGDSEPPLPDSVTDLGMATPEELRLEHDRLHPLMVDQRAAYRAAREPLEKTQEELRLAIESGDAEAVARLKPLQQSLAQEYQPVRTAFRETRARVRAIEARLEDQPDAPQPAEASN